MTFRALRLTLTAGVDTRDNPATRLPVGARRLVAVRGTGESAVELSLCRKQKRSSQMALIPNQFIDAVVAIGVATDSPGAPQWIGTGFLVGRLVSKGEGQRGYQLFLVTNKHVLAGKQSILFRFSLEESGQAKDFRYSLTNSGGNSTWSGHPSDDVDVAVIALSPAELRDLGTKVAFFQEDEDFFTITRMGEAGVSEGDAVFVLGFPMGIVSDDWKDVIVRGGTIARVRDALAGRAKTFLVDCQVFPGNSGGPVITKPELIGLPSTKQNNQAALVGIVTSYLLYEDIAVSLQTNKPRVVFQENSGLTQVVPVDSIIEAMDRWDHEHPATSAEAT